MKSKEHNTLLSKIEYFNSWEVLNRARLEKIYDLYQEEEMLCGTFPLDYKTFSFKIFKECPFTIETYVLGMPLILN
jgi:hypothetical protein